MAQKFSLIVLGAYGSTISHFHFSRKHLGALTCVVLISMLAIGYGLYHYLFLQSSLAGKRKIEHQLALQTDEVVLQRRQIQQFAQEINDLKKRVLLLNKLEERIRQMADIDQGDNQVGLFGMGGSAPDDLDPGVELTKKHHQLIKQMHQQVEQIGQASVHQQAALEKLLTNLEGQKNVLAHTPGIHPAEGFVSSMFNYRQSPFTKKREFHKGIDIANRKGTTVVATADGVVSFFGENGAFGRMMVIDHGHGITTRYAHLDKGLVKQGELVRRGDKIALMGNTGRSTGPHLHYEVRLHGVTVNPEKYMTN